MTRCSLCPDMVVRRRCLVGSLAVRFLSTLTAVVLAVASGCGTNQIDGIDPGGESSRTGGGGVPAADGGFIGRDAGTGTVSCSNDPGAVGRPPFPFMRATAPVLEGIGTAPEPPPPISGGTLLVLRSGTTAVAADPDRDRIYVVDLPAPGILSSPSPSLRASISVAPRDEPGRLVEDGAGLVHAILRNAGAVATIDPIAGTVVLRRAVCAMPRGLAYDPAQDVLHVACAGGELLTLTPKGTTPVRTLTLPQDLRDVVVDGARLMVSRFRSAEVMVLGSDGAMLELIRPASFTNLGVHMGSSFSPAVAWRMVAMPGGGAVMVHQRGVNGKVGTTSGGYGGMNPCDTIVHTSVTRMKPGQRPAAGPALSDFVLPVDVALSDDGARVALIAAGNGHAQPVFSRRLFVTNVDDVTTEWDNGCGIDDRHGPTPGQCSPARTQPADVAAMPVAGASTAGTCSNELPAQVEPVAVAFAGPNRVLVQTREPAQLWLVSDAIVTTVDLSQESRADTGHAVFHSNSGGGIACASCHPEGHEDGRIWDFACAGPRRTQDVGGGLIGTEPFHWEGDLPDFAHLVETVFVGRMSGPTLTRDQSTAALTWLNAVPVRPGLRAASDPQVQRGSALFNSPALGCSSCHAGPAFSNNATVDVGTSAAFQVPSLRGVGWRPPYMHDGCAPTLAARFGNPYCAGGDAHGNTSRLTPFEVDDLVAFLQSL